MYPVVECRAADRWPDATSLRLFAARVVAHVAALAAGFSEHTATGFAVAAKGTQYTFTALVLVKFILLLLFFYS